MMVRFLFLFIALNLTAGPDPLKTRHANQAKQRAENALVSNDYKAAIMAYNYLLDTLKIKDEKALLNLAHAYMKRADYSNATTKYTEASKSSDAKIKSIAYQQLGILQSEKGNREEAIAHFKNAIKFDPSNTQARFNYELMVKNKNKDIPKSQDKQQRQEEEKKKQEEDKKNQDKKDQQKKEDPKKSDQENKEPGKGDKKEDGEKNKGEKKDEKGKEGEKEDQKTDKKGNPDKNKEGEDNKEKNKEGDEKSGDSAENKSSKNKEDENSEEKGKADKASEKGDKKKNTETPNISANKEQLKKMNMTEHQAKAILNAMRQGEVQYIQQVKRTSGKKQKEKPKKDW